MSKGRAEAGGATEIGARGVSLAPAHGPPPELRGQKGRQSGCGCWLRPGPRARPPARNSGSQSFSPQLSTAAAPEPPPWPAGRPGQRLVVPAIRGGIHTPATPPLPKRGHAHRTGAVPRHSAALAMTWREPALLKGTPPPPLPAGTRPVPAPGLPHHPPAGTQPVPAQGRLGTWHQRRLLQGPQAEPSRGS